MGVQEILAVVAALAGVATSALSQRVIEEARQRILSAFGRKVPTEGSADGPSGDGPPEERLTPPSLEDRALRVAELIKESGSLIDELTAEMAARAAALEQLRAEAEHAQRVAEIHKEQQEAVAKILRLELERQEEQIRSELAKNNRRSFWQGFAVNIGVGLLFFVAGLLAPIGLR
ncbi:hypothetical protein NE236_37020 [Actinoallomurus purpureus]|uniref:hypothetical protein n=1 Tax=Actinoallomurus purpureus TaxID=478114 RepID=UPI00209346AF|nr:hypothetical protein [Actinoallomurus purpureus]MCO6010575.1 hypothetical protein [Actinoallomurus purpureus]